MNQNFILPPNSPIALFSCIECSFTISIMNVDVNILLISPSYLLICLAISSRPLEKFLSLSETANKVEFKDLSVHFATVICSFESLKNPFVPAQTRRNV